MAKHKAPSEVTLAPREEASEGVLLVQKHWPTAAGIALLGTAAIVLVQWRGESTREGELASWARLDETLQLSQGFSPPAATTLRELADELEDTPAGPWAKAAEVGKRLTDDDVEGARRAIGELETLWPDHPIASEPLFPRRTGDGPPRTLRNHVEAGLADLEAWKADHAELFTNPPLPEDAPRVRIRTSAGALVIGLYTDRAPVHAENFLKLCREGFYDGIKFHRVVRDFMVQAGDPNSRDDEAPETWGQGGPGYTLEPEVGSLWHFPGAVAAAATTAGGPTSGSQFYVVTGDDQHHLDGDYTVFGALMEGQDVVERIEQGPVLGDRPQEPVVIVSTEVL